MGRNTGDRFRRPNGNERFALILLCTTLLTAWVMDFRPSTQPANPRAPAPIARTPSTQTVATTDPQAGVHTRLTLEADPAAIRRELQMVREMGASWIVEYFPWLYLQPNGPDDYDWQHADLVIAEAHRQGLAVIARIDGVPAWARPADTSWKYLDATATPPTRGSSPRSPRATRGS